MTKWTLADIPSAHGRAVLTGANSGRLSASVSLPLVSNAAHPTLRAATAKGALSGSYFAPEHMFQLKGDPVPVPIPKPAQDVAAARQLWETAESLTGTAWRVAEPARAFAGR
jgi:hypothetical protein